MSLRCKFLILGIAIIFSCNEKPDKDIFIKSILFYDKVPTEIDRGILLTCVRCGCFIDEINSIYARKPELLKTVFIASDSTCNKLLVPTFFLPQSAADSISIEFYNAVVFERKDSLVKCRILSIKQSKELDEILATLSNSNATK